MHEKLSLFLYGKAKTHSDSLETVEYYGHQVCLLLVIELHKFKGQKLLSKNF